MKIIKEILPYVLIIIAVILIRTFIITPVRVDGASMDQTLEDGQILLLYKLANIDYGDIYLSILSKRSVRLLPNQINLLS